MKASSCDVVTFAGAPPVWIPIIQGDTLPLGTIQLTNTVARIGHTGSVLVAKLMINGYLNAIDEAGVQQNTAPGDAAEVLVDKTGPYGDSLNWVSSPSGVPQGAVLGGHFVDGTPLYVINQYISQGLLDIPGYFDPKNNCGRTAMYAPHHCMSLSETTDYFKFLVYTPGNALPYILPRSMFLTTIPCKYWAVVFP